MKGVNKRGNQEWGQGVLRDNMGVLCEKTLAFLSVLGCCGSEITLSSYKMLVSFKRSKTSMPSEHYFAHVEDHDFCVFVCLFVCFNSE